ncbi:sigma-70 family RNA polymerase sigma factor [Salinarimonas soli]|uniref:RNA polymerase sigma factor n=1 Tax=Salinarimonas soli TaxID=1638099 RepID=A0A5B2V8Z8_9HYPH|nr:sigma-70 family RNA polymerase sigma factor [Salinarimonas soli]
MNVRVASATAAKSDAVAEATGPRRKALGLSILDHLGTELRGLYAVETVPLPDILTRLLEQLGDKAPNLDADPQLRKDIVAAIPGLRAFAISLSGNVDRADDLVQETMLRGFANLDKFRPGTSLQAWLFTILRNLFHSEYRRRRREVEDPDGLWAGKLAVLPDQEPHLNLSDFKNVFVTLSDDQREALLLVGAEGFTYEEAAEICGVPVGTVKSRVNRARRRLAQLLAIDGAEDLQPDEMIQAAIASGADRGLSG